MPFLKPIKESRPWWRDAAEKVIRNGFRVATFGSNSKDKYTGEFKNDAKHGKGVQYYANATVYEGDWAHGTRQGHGTFSANCGHGVHSRIYTGLWYNDKPHGFGLRQYKDGSLYKGIFSQGMRHGYGCMYYPDGRIFMGRWVNDHSSGIGRLIRSDTKNYYEGTFRKGVKCGRGRYYHLNTGQIQDGVWENNIAKASLMWDDKRTRPIAKEPTPYPIPPVYLDEPISVYAEAALPIYEATKFCND